MDFHHMRVATRCNMYTYSASAPQKASTTSNNKRARFSTEPHHHVGWYYFEGTGQLNNHVQLNTIKTSGFSQFCWMLATTSWISSIESARGFTNEGVIDSLHLQVESHLVQPTIQKFRVWNTAHMPKLNYEPCAWTASIILFHACACSIVQECLHNPQFLNQSLLENETSICTLLIIFHH